ncbi:DUF1266 domain-containing protein [Pseudomonas mendocina]|nr:DUF1266 domain-containing protein [Pseudomonas mendocina]MBH3341476.1 DUF1266 domain-containing protein [Pseudomonas mendocina]
MDELQEKWLFALSAPMVAMNPGALYDLPRFYPDRDFIDLKESWDIDDRASLLTMIQRMTDDGHASDLSALYWDHARMLPSEWQARLDGLEQGQRVVHQYVAETILTCGAGGIRAWDLGRMSFLARIGELNGWLSPQENLWLHNRLSLRARYYYQSWHSYLAGFLIGRAYWRCLGSEPAEQALLLSRQGSDSSTFGMVQELALNPAARLDHLPWELELDLLEKPDTLEELDWS